MHSERTRKDGWPRGLIALPVFALCCAWTSEAQTRPVFVTASFTDRNQIFMENLSAEEIEVSEDGQPRKIEFIAMEQLPSVYGILIESALLADSTGDTRYDSRGVPGANLARDILYELIDKYLGRHPVWVGAYQRDLEVVLDFTSDPFRVKDSVEQLRVPKRRSDSNLYTSLFSAVRKMSERNEKRRVLLLFLESVDPESAGRTRQLKNLFAASNVELFAISFSSRIATAGGLNPQVGEAVLRDIVGSTAGQAFQASANRDHPEDITRRLLNQIRTFHTIGFQASSPRESPGKLIIRSTRSGSNVKHHPVVPALNM